MRLGRIVVVVLVSISAVLATMAWDPNSRGNFFLRLSRQISYLTPGLTVAFFLGIFWRRATARSAVAAILASPVLGLFLEWGYAAWFADAVDPTFGHELNFMHRTFLVLLGCLGVQCG